MSIEIIIHCIKKDNNVIKYLGIERETDKVVKIIPELKSDIIQEIRNLEKDGKIVIIKTFEGNMVIIVDNKYLRTDKDYNTKNDLLDLPECKNIFII